MGRFIKDIVIKDNVIGYGETGIANISGDDVTISGNRYIDNNKNYSSSKIATGTIYKDNRNVTVSEKNGLCYTVNKFTNPHSLCLSGMGLFRPSLFPPLPPKLFEM